MICVVTDITISDLNISPILDIHLHYRESCECNCSIKKIPIFDIVMPYKSLWKFLRGFAQNPKYNFISQNSSFFDPPSTDNLHRKPCTY